MADKQAVTLDTVRATLSTLGTGWDANTVPGLLALYEPLQAAQNSKYADRVTVTRSKYGSHDRHRANIYRPTSTSTSTSTNTTSSSSSSPSREALLPVVVYIHGGGYVGGDTKVTDNVYANVGNYFASRAHVCVVITYRLAFQGAHFPDGAEDVASALVWVRDNIAQHGGDPGRVVTMGQSAGGSHLSSALFLGLLDGGEDGGAAKEPLIKGVVLLSAAFQSNPDGEMYPILKEYFQTGDKAELATRWGPGALFRQEYFFGGGDGKTKPRGELPCEVLVMWSEWEAGEIVDGTVEWFEDYRKKFRRLPILETMKGHNHVSYCFGLGLEGEEYEKVGRRLVEFVAEVTR